jgi:hypothetical protein
MSPDLSECSGRSALDKTARQRFLAPSIWFSVPVTFVLLGTAYVLEGPYHTVSAMPPIADGNCRSAEVVGLVPRADIRSPTPASSSTPLDLGAGPPAGADYGHATTGVSLINQTSPIMRMA